MNNTRTLEHCEISLATPSNILTPPLGSHPFLDPLDNSLFLPLPSSSPTSTPTLLSPPGLGKNPIFTRYSTVLCTVSLTLSVLESHELSTCSLVSTTTAACTPLRHLPRLAYSCPSDGSTGHSGCCSPVFSTSACSAANQLSRLATVLSPYPSSRKMAQKARSLRPSTSEV